MEDIDYKEQDRKAILDYLAGKGEVIVAGLLDESGANRLRVYGLIFELRDAGLVEITNSSELGTPLSVKMVE